MARTKEELEVAIMCHEHRSENRFRQWLAQVIMPDLDYTFNGGRSVRFDAIDELLHPIPHLRQDVENLRKELRELSVPK